MIFERSFFSGDDALVLALALAPAFDFAFALAAADFSEPGLPERLLLLLLLPELPFSVTFTRPFYENWDLTQRLHLRCHCLQLTVTMAQGFLDFWVL